MPLLHAASKMCKRSCDPHLSKWAFEKKKKTALVRKACFKACHLNRKRAAPGHGKAPPIRQEGDATSAHASAAVR